MSLVMEAPAARVVLPAKQAFPTSSGLLEARREYARRVTERLAAHGPAYVEVGYNPDAVVYEGLQRAQEAARLVGRHALVVTEHRVRNEEPVWLCSTLLTTLVAVARCRSVPEFLRTFALDQQQTHRPPGSRWGRIQQHATRESARAGSLRIPVLVEARHGTRQGVAVAPLHWFLHLAPLQGVDLRPAVPPWHSIAPPPPPRRRSPCARPEPCVLGGHDGACPSRA